MNIPKKTDGKKKAIHTFPTKGRKKPNRKGFQTPSNEYDTFHEDDDSYPDIAPPNGRD